MTKLITGIGGLFFRAKDPKSLTSWYAKHFGTNATQSETWNQEAGPTVFAPFKEDTDYFGNKEQQFMINFRVSDLDELLKNFEAAEIRIDKNRINESYGKFAWVYDPEGNKIELWQAMD